MRYPVLPLLFSPQMTHRTTVPIRPGQRWFYPIDWRELSQVIPFRARRWPMRALQKAKPPTDRRRTKRLVVGRDPTRLALASNGSADIDQVFITGGSSLIPAVHDIFARRFGADRVAVGGEFTSIAHGLALIGQRYDVAEWST